jgi:hypothetical protein
MEQRLGGRIRAEISADSRKPHEPEVYREIRIAEQTPADVAKLDRRRPEPAGDPDGAAHDKERRQDSLCPLGVERPQREMADRALGENDARNEKARNDEEDVDAGEAPRDERAIGVESNHPEDRERAQAIDVVAEFEIAPNARGGEVGSVEDFVQHVPCRG